MARKKLTFADKTTMDLNCTASEEILEVFNRDRYKRYGVKIDKNNSDPEARIEYMYDAVGFTPAHMNYATGAFDYGSWGDVWFIKENYPVMLKSNGEVAYKLDPNDYSKKEDGSSSDIRNVNFDGNAMSRIPIIYVAFWEDTSYEYITVCQEKYDERYNAIAHTKEDGTIVDEIFLAMFTGSLDSNNKLRSLSGVYPMMKNAASDEITYATNNGSGWYTRTWGQRQLINALLTIIGKSDNTQEVFGNGACTGYNSSDSHGGLPISGTINDKGQFYGTNDNITHVKVFHMEDWWGNQNERIAGLINDNGTIKVSLTGPYNTTGEGYDTVSCPTPNGTSGGYITKVTTSKYGRIPYSTNGGTETTYLCDAMYFNNEQLNYPSVGCSAGDKTKCGAYAIALSDLVSKAWYNFSSCLSFV